jgi:murein L,D-transpeptidase YcbB/YkuD
VSIKYLSIFSLLFLMGCSTMQGPSQTSNLQIKVAQLERRVNDRDKKISDLNYEVERLSDELDLATSLVNENIEEPFYFSQDSSLKGSVEQKPSSKEDTRIIRVNVKHKDLQKALKNSGYYEGKIDGKIGSGSKKAIKKFQQAYDLKADGIVGKKTWAQLKVYLD